MMDGVSKPIKKKAVSTNELLALIAKQNEQIDLLTAEFTNIKQAIPDAQGIVDKTAGFLAPKLIEHINEVIAKSGVSEAVASLQVAQREFTEQAERLKQAKVKAEAGVVAEQEPATDEPSAIPAESDGKANMFFEMGKGFAAGVGENMKAFQPALELVKTIFGPKEANIEKRINDYLLFSRYEKSGGDIEALKKVTTGQP